MIEKHTAQGGEGRKDKPAASDLIHREVWDTLPQDAEKKMLKKAENRAVKEGVSLQNARPDPGPGGAEPDNKVMFQYFEWHLANDGAHWDRLRDDARHLAGLGVGGVWIPPCCKATATGDVGYGVYDLYDLGEFDQKGSVRTKYGTRDALEACIASLHAGGIKVYADAVLNHKAGADGKETFMAVPVDPENREREAGAPREIEAWTRFTFPGRKGKYSAFTWNHNHFTAVDRDERTGENGIFRILGENKGFSPRVDREKGNFDYLMFADVDYRNSEVIDETLRWGDWFVRELDLDGLRLDAIKHIHSSFISAFLRETRLRTKKSLYCVGEYWHGDEGILSDYIGETRDQMALFDVALHFNFFDAANWGKEYDLRDVFSGTLLQRNNLNVVTFVDNHDSQPGQSLGSWVQDWFKPLAYALILLRRDGYPCVFYGDYYGIGGEAPPAGMRDMLDLLLDARKRLAYGEQRDYFASPTLIGWTRRGDPARDKSGLAALLSTDGPASLHMSFGESFEGTRWRDLTGHVAEPVVIEGGEGEFRCEGRSLSVYARE